MGNIKRKSRYFFLKQYKITKGQRDSIKSFVKDGVKMWMCPFCVDDINTVSNFSNIASDITYVEDHMHICDKNPNKLKQMEKVKKEYDSICSTLCVEKNKIENGKLMICTDYMTCTNIVEDTNTNKNFIAYYENSKFYFGNMTSPFSTNGKANKIIKDVIVNKTSGCREMTNNEKYHMLPMS
jgi:hypothetical protein